MNDEFSRLIFLKPKEQDRDFFNIESDEFLRVTRPLYGICDCDDYWSVTFMSHIEGDLLMTPGTGDPSRFLKEGNDDADGLLRVYADDCLFSGNTSFQKITEQTSEKFESTLSHSLGLKTKRAGQCLVPRYQGVYEMCRKRPLF